MNYESHLIVGMGSLSAFLLAVEVTGFAPISATIPLAAGLGMTTLGAIAPDIDHPRTFISSTLPALLMKLGVRLLIFISIPAILTIASGRRVKLMEPDQLIQDEVFRLLVVVILGSVSLLVISRFIHQFFKHRGPIHSPAFFVGITILLTILLALFVSNWWWMGLAFGWGWLSHIGADSLTPLGIPLFWPLSNEKMSLLPDILLAPAQFFTVICSVMSVVLLVARLVNVK